MRIIEMFSTVLPNQALNCLCFTFQAGREDVSHWVTCSHVHPCQIHSDIHKSKDQAGHSCHFQPVIRGFSGQSEPKSQQSES